MIHETDLRILLVGPGGAGKSTLAAALAERSGAPIIDMDVEFWRPGWEPTCASDWARRVEELVARPAWVMDGTHGDSLAAALTRAQLVLLLTPAPGVLLRRLLRRRWSAARRFGPHLRERLPWSFVVQTLTYRRTIMPQVVAGVRGAGLRLVILRSVEEASRWLDEYLPPAVAPDGAR